MAKIISWGIEYLINIPEIDDQHKEFVNIINKLYWADEQKYPRDIGTRIVYELLKYAEFHFVCEENTMMIYRYNGLTHQMDEHKRLLNVMKVKMNEFSAGKSDYDSIAKYAFMWLISHTVEEDKKFGIYYNALKANPVG